MKLQLGLEWFVNPDHPPLIAGIELGWYRCHGSPTARDRHELR